MKKILALLTMFAVSYCSPANAALELIGDFETTGPGQLSDWNLLGSVVEATAIDGAVPTAGSSQMALITAGVSSGAAGQADGSTIISELMLSSLPGSPVNGANSAMYFDKLVTQLEPGSDAEIVFDYSFMTNENDGLPEYAFVSVVHKDGIAAEQFFILGSTEHPVNSGTSFLGGQPLFDNTNTAASGDVWTGPMQSFSMQLTELGEYRIGFGVISAFNQNNPSRLFIDQSFAAVPEPGSLALCLAGVAAVGFRRRRR